MTYKDFANFANVKFLEVQKFLKESKGFVSEYCGLQYKSKISLGNAKLLSAYAKKKNSVSKCKHFGSFLG